MSQAPDSSTASSMAVSQEKVAHHQSPRQRRKLEKARMDLNLTSMIDVIFQLLIYFVITANFAVGEGVITAELPQGTGTADPLEPPPENLDVNIASAGTAGYHIFIEGQGRIEDFVTLANVLSSLQDNPSRGWTGPYPADTPVRIKPDGEVRWEHVVNAFNAAVKARYEDVQFMQATAGN